MSLARGKFGIEYNPRQLEPKSSGLGWVFVLVALVALISFAWTLVKHFRSHGEEAAQEVAVHEPPPSSAAEAPPPVNGGADVPPPSPVQAKQVFQTFQPMNTELDKRPSKLRTLLMRLDEAEKRQAVEMAVNTIETIRSLPGSPAADLDDSLARRLGKLNLRRLFDLHNGQWVKAVVVRRGDSASRIAAENGSTLASFSRLNGGNVDRVVLGAKVLVMDHPRFNLVIRRRTRIADLSLNGKFFKRYDLAGTVSADEGTYEMPERRRTFWTGVGAAFNPDDRAELDLLMPNGAPVLVS